MSELTLEEFQSRIRKSSSKLVKKINRELKISALRMEGRSKQISFSRFKNRTTNLRGSIAGNFGIFNGRPAAFLQAGGQFGGNDIFYAEFIEFGKSEATGSRRITPRLFMGRSVEVEEKLLDNKFKEILKEALEG